MHHPLRFGAALHAAAAPVLPLGPAATSAQVAFKADPTPKPGPAIMATSAADDTSEGTPRSAFTEANTRTVYPADQVRIEFAALHTVALPEPLPKLTRSIELVGATETPKAPSSPPHPTSLQAYWGA